jgi:hypothetical protein
MEKRLQDIAKELKDSAEQILGCELVLLPYNTKLIEVEQGFVPVARFADNIPRKTDDKNFVIFNGKKCFSKKIDKFEYLLEIIDLS